MWVEPPPLWKPISMVEPSLWNGEPPQGLFRNPCVLPCNMNLKRIVIVYFVLIQYFWFSILNTDIETKSRLILHPNFTSIFRRLNFHLLGAFILFRKTFRSFDQHFWIYQNTDINHIFTLLSRDTTHRIILS
jgi:hypothetical protein